MIQVRPAGCTASRAVRGPGDHDLRLDRINGAGNLGFAKGENVAIEFRSAKNDLTRQRDRYLDGGEIWRWE
jgi:hypothetical protein